MSKTRTLLRGIARENMLAEGIYRPNKKHKRKKESKARSFLSRHWRGYCPPRMIIVKDKKGRIQRVKPRRRTR